MASVMMKYLIPGLLVLGVLLASLGTHSLMSKIWASTFQTGFDDIPLSERNAIEDDFNQLVENIKECKDMEDKFCLCDGLSRFPNTFDPKSKESMLEIENKGNDTKISLLFNGQPVLDENIEKSYLSGIFSLFGKWGELSEIRNYEKKLISFDLLEAAEPFSEIHGKTVEYYPYFISPSSSIFGRQSGAIVGEKLYKAEDENVFFTSLPLRTGKDPNYSTIVLQKNQVGETPKCLPERAEAIKQFDQIIELLSLKKEQKITIKLPENYKLWIYAQGKSISLNYQEGGEKGELAERYNSNTNKKETLVKTYQDSIKCSDSDKEETLLDGDAVDIKMIAGRACIEKIIN